MKFLALDDEPLALEDLKEVLLEAEPGCQILDFTSPARALEAAKKERIDVAFLDIELGTMNGLVAAKQLKDADPETKIIFVTSHEKYAVGAFRIHATGYLLKPVTAEDIRRELTFIYGSAGEEKRRNVRIQTFGGFSVYVGGEPLHFSRAKSKELLAYLVNRRGAPITTPHACAVLWEDEPYDRKKKNYFQSILLDLKRTLREAGIEDILVRKRNSLAVDPSRFECDSYQFLAGDPRAVNSYRHDYLCDYSWAEFMVGDFERDRDL